MIQLNLGTEFKVAYEDEVFTVSSITIHRIDDEIKKKIYVEVEAIDYNSLDYRLKGINHT